MPSFDQGNCHEIPPKCPHLTKVFAQKYPPLCALLLIDQPPCIGIVPTHLPRNTCETTTSKDGTCSKTVALAGGHVCGGVPRRICRDSNAPPERRNFVKGILSGSERRGRLCVWCCLSSFLGPRRRGGGEQRVLLSGQPSARQVYTHN
jgi:hypothetical protein